MTKCKIEWSPFDRPAFWVNLKDHVSENGRLLISLLLINEFLRKNGYECKGRYRYEFINSTCSLKECMIFQDEETMTAFILEWS